MCADIDEIAQNSSLRLTARARQLKLIDVIAGLFEAKHASNPIQEMREFLRELRISISGFNKAQPLFPYKIFQRVARAETLLDLFRGLALRDPFPMEVCS